MSPGKSPDPALSNIGRRVQRIRGRQDSNTARRSVLAQRSAFFRAPSLTG